MKRPTAPGLIMLICVVSSAVPTRPVVRVYGQTLPLPPTCLSSERLVELFFARADRKPTDAERRELDRVLRRYNRAALVVSIAARIDMKIREQLFPVLCSDEVLALEYRILYDQEKLNVRREKLLARSEALDFVAQNPGMAREAYERFGVAGSLQRWLEAAANPQHRRTVARELDIITRQLAGETVVTKALQDRVYLKQLEKHVLEVAAQESPAIAAYCQAEGGEPNAELEAQAYRIWRAKVVKEAGIKVLDPQYAECVAEYLRDPVSVAEPYLILETCLQSLGPRTHD